MSTPTTEEPFTIFHKFPPEVQLEILRQCSEGDLVCLSLTCRDMHYLAKPLLSEKPDLSKVDQLGSTPDMPQDCMDSDYQCRNGTKGCKGVRGKIVAYDPDTHRNRRHYYKKRYAACYECRAYPPEHPVCQVAGCKKHCACISCPLFVRLRDWMGSRKYCRTCNKFTTRRKSNNRRCKLTSDSLRADIN